MAFRKVSAGHLFKSYNSIHFNGYQLSLQLRKQGFCSQVNESDDKAAYDEEQLKKLQNISRLPHHLRARMDHVKGFSSHVHEKQYRNLREQRTEQRQFYAKVGKNSRLDPGIMFDTREEYTESIAEELLQPSLEEAVRLCQEEQLMEKLSKKERVDKVKVRMEVLMPELLEAKRKNVLAKKNIKPTAKKMAHKVKLEGMLEEARNYLGYTVTRHDPEFRALLEKISHEEREKKKREKKEAKMLKKKAELAVSRQTTDSRPATSSETEKDQAIS